MSSSYTHPEQLPDVECLERNAPANARASRLPLLPRKKPLLPKTSSDVESARKKAPARPVTPPGLFKPLPPTSCKAPECGEKGRFISQSTHHVAAAVITTILPIIGLVSWAARFAAIGDKLDLVSHPIGGKLTQFQAKSIDFVAGAVLSPLLFLCLNWYWFSSLRVTAFSERDSRGIPLMTVVEASRTDFGSYNLFKLANFLRGGPKMVAFGAAVLFSAISHTCFANMIAYEAFHEAGPASMALKYDFTLAETAALESQIFRLFADISYYGTSDLLEDGAYIGINVTRATLNTLPAQVVGLRDISGYRLSVECDASRPTAIQIMQRGQELVQVRFKTLQDLGNFTGTFDAQYAGNAVALTGADNEIYPFAGFPTLGPASSVYLSELQSFNLTGNEPIQTPYGNLTYNAFDMKAPGVYTGPGAFSSTKAVMSGAGLKCAVRRQTGVLNLTRRADLTWTGSPGWWSEQRSIVDLMLADFQTHPIFHVPQALSAQPGLGPVFRTSAVDCPGAGEADRLCWLDPVKAAGAIVNYRLIAQNTLYAAAEVERLVYETKHGARNDSTGEIPVAATATRQLYRMTYVPVILLAGLLSTLVAAAVALAMAMMMARTSRFQTWREVDSLRLLIDSAEGLCAEPEVREVQTAGKATQEKMARRVAVRYSGTLDTVGLVLRTPSFTSTSRRDAGARRTWS